MWRRFFDSDSRLGWKHILSPPVLAAPLAVAIFALSVVHNTGAQRSREQVSRQEKTAATGSSATGFDPSRSLSLSERRAQELSPDTSPAPDSCPLVDETGQRLRPMDVLAAGDDLYFLGQRCLWFCPNGVQASDTALRCATLAVPDGKLDGVPIQEWLSFAFWPSRKSVVVLDKSGSLFEYGRAGWRLLKANVPRLGSPDPHYIGVCAAGPSLLLVDPERNQIWRFTPPDSLSRSFPEVLPWRIRPGDPNVADAIGCAYDGALWLLRKGGRVSRYPVTQAGARNSPSSAWKPLPRMRPSRIATTRDAGLFLVERENNRVIALDKKGGRPRQYLFPQESDLRGLLPCRDGFRIIDGDRLVSRKLSSHDPMEAKPEPRRIDSRLDGLVIPVKGASLPGHTGVFPGARRLYRYGIHGGVDFFHDPGRGTHVAMNTPARAAEAGKVTRADLNFSDMDAKQYARVMRECARDHVCSEANEDLFRGCQVWLDHGNGLVTRYAHLSKARSDLRPGMLVNRGEVIGYIGVSGTGENLPGRVKRPHLHFEIWLDDHYLGYGLNLAETIGLYEDIFGSSYGK